MACHPDSEGCAWKENIEIKSGVKPQSSWEREHLRNLCLGDRHGDVDAELTESSGCASRDNRCCAERVRACRCHSLQMHLDIVLACAELAWLNFELLGGQFVQKHLQVDRCPSTRHWDRQLRARTVNLQDTDHIQTLPPLRHSEPGAVQDLVLQVVAQLLPCVEAEPEDSQLVRGSCKLWHLLHDEHQRLVVRDVSHALHYQVAVDVISNAFTFA